MMNHERVSEILLSKSWKFAKTMAKIPHSYTLEKNWGDKDLYKEVAEFITEHGDKRLFFRRFYYYYTIDDNEYWAMKINDGSGIINRAIIKPNSDWIDYAKGKK